MAEGVETEAEFAALRAIGCEYGQGYLFGRPMPVADALGLASHGGEANALNPSPAAKAAA